MRRRLTKSQVKLLKILKHFPDGLKQIDLLSIYGGEKTIQEVKFEYNILQFNLKKGTETTP
jgi:hypothetical protein